MSQGLIFANARAKAKEMNLLTQDRLLRMMEASSLQDAVRILVEANFGEGAVIDDDNDFEKLLQAEEQAAVDFVKEVAPENAGFECFFLMRDYHNIKCLLKQKYGELGDISQMLMRGGLYGADELKKRVEEDKLDMTEELKAAALTIEKKFDAGEGNPRLIDTLTDKAMFADITRRLKGGDKYVKEYFEALIDTANVLTFLRTRDIGGGIAFFESNFIEGGSLPFKLFEECMNDAYNKLALTLKGTKYFELAAKIEEGDLTAYETWRDNYLLKLFSANKADMFSAAPIVGYYLAKLNEIKVIRIVLVCIKNKVNKADMKKRVRALYA